MISADKVIIGGGIFGLYAALFCVQHNQKVIILERDNETFERASYINQGRIHNGYHYPRSYSTAIKSAQYFQRFSNDFDFCINNKFKQIYAISKDFSWVNAKQFSDFCKDASLFCKEIEADNYLKDNTCDGIFETQEYTFDARILKKYFLEKLSSSKACSIKYNSVITEINNDSSNYIIQLENGEPLKTSFILNATYANINQVQNFLGFDPFKIRYELCEIIKCQVSNHLKDIGITLMDGPFFSLMPFGKTGCHSISAVQYTPHKFYEGFTPTFDCQDQVESCNFSQLDNCNICNNKPKSNWQMMKKLAMKYLHDEIELKYIESLFTIKSVLISSDIDDSRPTIIKEFSKDPHFYTVFSGKINTIYEMDNILA